MASIYKRLSSNNDLGPVSISGPVTVTNEVEVKNDIGNPIPVSNTDLAPDASTLSEQQIQTGHLTDAVSELQSANLTLISIDSRVDGVEASLTAIESDTSNLDVLLSTRASESTLSTRASEATLATRSSEVTLLTRASESTLATRASEATLATRASESTLATRATEATLSALNSKVVTVDTDNVTVTGTVLAPDASTLSEQQLQTAQLSAINADLDVALSTRASESTLATRASESTLATRASESTLSTRASEATVLTLGTEATLATRASEATLLTRASEATLLTLGTEATLSTRATEATLLTRASEATLATRATEATLLTRASEATLSALNNKVNTATSSPLHTDSGIVVRPIPYENATFMVSVEAVVPAANKHMFSIMNALASPVVVRIQSIKIINVQNTAVAGAVCDFRGLFITSLTGGTAATSISFDSADVLSGSVTAATNGTVGGLGTIPLLRNKWSSDEWGSGTADVESTDHVNQTLFFSYESRPNVKPITLRAGQGLTIQQVAAVTVGSFDIQVVYTTE
jgi:hypothetical protein